MKKVLSSIVTLAFAGMVGCADNKQPVHTGFFPSESGDRMVERLVDVQMTNGAREDASLHAIHFDGAKLNSLGTQKLARMVPTEPTGSVVVYLSAAADDMTTARRDAVTAYMGACGVDASRLRLENGSNPNSASPAAEGLLNIGKTDTATGGGGDAPSAAASIMK